MWPTRETCTQPGTFSTSLGTHDGISQVPTVPTDASNAAILELAADGFPLFHAVVRMKLNFFANGRGRVSPRAKGKLFPNCCFHSMEGASVNYGDAPGICEYRASASSTKRRNGKLNFGGNQLNGERCSNKSSHHWASPHGEGILPSSDISLFCTKGHNPEMQFIRPLLISHLTQPKSPLSIP